jgi:hypothetical protein
MGLRVFGMGKYGAAIHVQISHSIWFITIPSESLTLGPEPWLWLGLSQLMSFYFTYLCSSSVLTKAAFY